MGETNPEGGLKNSDKINGLLYLSKKEPKSNKGAIESIYNFATNSKLVVKIETETSDDCLPLKVQLLCSDSALYEKEEGKKEFITLNLNIVYAICSTQ